MLLGFKLNNMSRLCWGIMLQLFLHLWKSCLYCFNDLSFLFWL